MSDRKLGPSIVLFLAEKTGKKITTIKKDIYSLRQSYPGIPINAVAQIYAIQNGTSILRKLTIDEKRSLPNLEIEKPRIVKVDKPKKSKERKIIEFIKFRSDDIFVQDHVDEINRAYTFGCFTAVLIMSRKLIENLFVSILRQKYPSDVHLYFNTGKGRMRDFSELLSTLRKKAPEFGPEKKLLERILGKVDTLKGDMNDKVHSLFHIVKSRKELNGYELPYIIALIDNLEKLEAKKKSPVT